jgi:hypothetical protein
LGLAQVKDPKFYAALGAHLEEFRQKLIADTKVDFLSTEKPDQSYEPLDKTLVFNQSHLKVFSADPMYRDLFTYINSFYPELISMTELATAFQVPLDQIRKKVLLLEEMGVVSIQNENCKVTKSLLYFPDDPEFFELRNKNISYNFNALLEKLQHVDTVSRKAFRGLYSRELSAEQVELLILKLEEVANQVMGFPVTSHAQSVYSLCLLLGVRFSRPDALLP